MKWTEMAKMMENDVKQLRASSFTLIYEVSNCNLSLKLSHTCQNINKRYRKYVSEVSLTVNLVTKSM